MAETQNDPLLPGYSFNAHLVTGLTPIEAQGYLDFFIDRPLGMKGYILNLTIRGEGVINNHGEQFVCRPGDMLLFPPGEIHHYGRHPDASEWYHQWVYFRPRAYWHEWLNWPTIFAQTGFFRPDEQWQARFGELFGQIVDAGQGAGRYSELLAINLLEQLLLRRMEAINESLHPPCGIITSSNSKPFAMWAEMITIPCTKAELWLDRKLISGICNLSAISRACDSVLQIIPSDL